jgi:hypothetical protein
MIEQGIDRVAAAKQVGLRPDSLRRWLRTREVLAFLRQGHDYHLATLNAANPTKLAEIRDTSPNWTSRVQAIRTMADLGEQVSRQSGTVQTPGVVLRLVTVVQDATAQTIDVVPTKLLPTSDEEPSEPGSDRFGSNRGSNQP